MEKELAQSNLPIKTRHLYFSNLAIFNPTCWTVSSFTLYCQVTMIVLKVLNCLKCQQIHTNILQIMDEYDGWVDLSQIT